MNNGELKVWHIPQVPGKAFEVPVPTLEVAGIITDTLAQYDLFQYKNKIKPDYANAGGVMVIEDGEWVDWYSPDGEDFDEWWQQQKETK